ncbi:MAG: ABC transporter permease [Lachnospiraceae bacterium]|nr:ABC transporter permease [Lachnospiraceae bacterium]
MIKIVQGELFRIRKNHLFKICLAVSIFFVFSLALTFHYNTIKLSTAVTQKASLNDYTQFLFSDYSLILPITIFLCCYFTENSRTGTCSVFLSKGVTRASIYFGKLISSWIVTVIYMLLNFLMAYVFILAMWANQPYIDCSFLLIGTYLLLQILCFMGYASFVCLLSNLFRYRNLVLTISVFLLGALYFYLTKISSALDLSYSLYCYWIVGLSHAMEIKLVLPQLPAIVLTITGYVLFPTLGGFFIYKKMDLRKQERR